MLVKLMCSLEHINLTIAFRTMRARYVITSAHCRVSILVAQCLDTTLRMLNAKYVGTTYTRM